MSRTPPCTHAGGGCRARVAVASVVLAGCAAPASQPPPPVVVVPSQPNGPVVGVAVIEPQSDVADLTEAMRHVLHPSGDIGSASVAPAGPGGVRAAGPAPQPAAPGPLGAPAPRAVVAPDSVKAAPGVSGRDTGSAHPYPAAPDAVAVRGNGTSPQAADAGEVGSPAVLQPARAARDAIIAAWEHYCVSSELSPEQWSIIDRTAMPAALEAEWAVRCRPRK